MNKGSDYKKMSGSIDSMDKSQLNSSLEEDTQSYDIYEAHNPSAVEAVNPGFDLAYRNQGILLMGFLKQLSCLNIFIYHQNITFLIKTKHL